jgi:asparagine synthase (glutamine-hydrolysing)
MCGIAGILYFDTGRSAEPALIKAMADSIRHRGPDDEGYHIQGNVALGHRRLSIIDLEHGKQPIENEDGSCHIVFNGEIYNFRPLRAELISKGHLFRTNTDTEVILHAYEEYGEDCVKKLNGMFAFAIWDSKRQVLFLARDHLGVKPLYYYLDGEKALFASELKAILEDPSVDRQIDADALDAYFSYMYIPDPLSIFKSILKLEAGHTLTLRQGKAHIRKYWDVENRGSALFSEGQWVERLESLLAEATKGQLMSDVPLGVFLSGGLDSSSLVGLMRRFSDSVQTFSLSGGQGLFNELPYARIIATKYGTKHHELVVPENELEALLPEVAGFLDEPMADSSIIPTFLISRFARGKVKVALSGEGGDELFGGYTWHRKHLTIDKYRRFVPLELRKKLIKRGLESASRTSPALGKFVRPWMSLNNYSLMEKGRDFETLRRLFTDGLKDQIYGSGVSRSRNGGIWAIDDAYSRNAGKNGLDNALYADLKVYLPGDLLTKVDRMSMANSLEVRVPFLDYRIVELAAGIPSNLKIKAGQSKYILRKAMARELPEAILNRKIKRGFSVPVMDWFRGNLKDFAWDVLTDKKTLERGYIRADGVKGLLEDHQAGKPLGDQIFLLIVLELWARRYLDRAPAKPTLEPICLPA